MREELNQAANAPDTTEEQTIDRLPPEDDEFRKTIIFQLPRTVEDEETQQPKTQWTWHVIEVPESFLDTYNQACDDHAKDNQILIVKKRGEAKKPGLYLDDGENEPTLLAYVIESGKGKLSPEEEEALDEKYFQNNNDNVASNDNDEQANGLDKGGDKHDGIAPH